jgi:hypothetical protein
VIDGTSGGYLLSDTIRFRSGAKAFHLAFSTPVRQQFELDRDFYVGSGDAIRFWKFLGYMTATNRASLEVSVKGSGVWSEVWGVYGTDSYDSNWSQVNQSLSPWLGKVIRLRFALAVNGGSYYSGVSAYTGVFIDDIDITDLQEPSGSLVTSEIVSSATSVPFTPTTAGDYILSLQAKLDATVYPAGNGLLVNVTESPLTTWKKSYFNAGQMLDSSTSGDAADFDGDGFGNLLEYALDGNPTVSDGSIKPVVSTNVSPARLKMTFKRARADILYELQGSGDLLSWTTIPGLADMTAPEKVGQTITVMDNVDISAGARRFLRLKVMVP